MEIPRLSCCTFLSLTHCSGIIRLIPFSVLFFLFHAPNARASMFPSTSPDALCLWAPAEGAALVLISGRWRFSEPFSAPPQTSIYQTNTSTTPETYHKSDFSLLLLGGALIHFLAAAAISIPHKFHDPRISCSLHPIDIRSPPRFAFFLSPHRTRL